MTQENTWIIGDIHGALLALEQVLEKLQLQDQDNLIFMGDYVDGWPESAGVIERLIGLSKTYNCIFLKGNHDVDCASWLSGNETDEEWLMAKEDSMIKSYRGSECKNKVRHLNFFSNLKDYHIDNGNRLFVHAGFTSLKGPSEETFAYNFNNDRTLLETALAMDKNLTPNSLFYPKRLKLFNEIFIGHTPTTKYGITVPINAGNLWDVDTGATYQGRISALNMKTKEFHQSEKVEDIYGK